MHYPNYHSKKVGWSFILLSLVLHACTPAKEASSQDTEEAKRIALTLFELFNKHDWKQYAALYSADAKFVDPAYGKTEVTQSPGQLVEKYSGFQHMFPDIRDDIKNVLASGNSVVVEFVSSGTDSTGNKFTLPIITVLTVEKGKIVRDATYYDM